MVGVKYLRKDMPCAGNAKPAATTIAEHLNEIRDAIRKHGWVVKCVEDDKRLTHTQPGFTSAGYLNYLLPA